MTSEISTECFICGNNITAGTYPPICDRSECQSEFKLECEFNAWAKREMNRGNYVLRRKMD